MKRIRLSISSGVLTLVVSLALSLGAGTIQPTIGAEAQVVEIKVMQVFIPASVTIKPGEVTFVLTNVDRLEHWFAILNADGEKVAEINPKPDLTCVWEGKPIGCGRTLSTGEIERVTFKLGAGKYTYLCFPHADAAAARFGYKQVGTLTVGE